jgi:hypothetical protein
MSIKSRNLLLVLYKIFIPIYVFLLAFQNLKDTSAVEVRSSSSQPASYGFLGDLSGDLLRVRTSGSLRGRNPACRVDGGALPSRSFESSARLVVQCQTPRC